MTIPTRAVSVTLREQDNDPIVGAVFSAKLTIEDVYQDQVVSRVEQQAVTDANGRVTLNLFPNVLGERGTSYMVKVLHPTTGRVIVRGVVRVPDTDCELTDLLGNTVAGTAQTDTEELIKDLLAPGFVAKVSPSLYALRTLRGTSNQVIVANSDGSNGNPTFSLPQDIHTGASPSFANLTIAGAIAAASLALSGALSAPTVSASGQFLAANGSAAAPSYAFTNFPGTGIYSGGANGRIAFTDGAGNTIFASSGGGPRISVNSSLGWSPSGDPFTGVDLFLFRDAANILAQRNGATAQIFRPYNTFTDAANYERAQVGWSGNAFRIWTEGAGTGSNGRSLLLGTGGAGQWIIDGAAHHLQATPDNSFDIGGSGALRPRSIYWGTQALGADGTAAAPSHAFASAVGSGLFKHASFGGLSFSAAGVHAARLDNTGNFVTLGSLFIGASGVDLNSTLDTILVRDAANTLARRNGTTAQTDRLYNTFTDASNYERLAITWSTNIAFISTEAAGTGAARELRVGSGGATPLTFFTTGTNRWQFSSTGHLLAITDNTLDIGASGATRPRSVYWGTQALGSDGSATNPSHSFASDTNTGMWRNAASRITLTTGGINELTVGQNFVQMHSAGLLSWSSSTDSTGTGDLILTREAASVLAQRNGVNAQTSNLYNTFTDAANYERAALSWSGNIFHVTTQALGTGVVRGIRLRAGNSNGWLIDSSNHVTAVTDNVQDIGAAGATRPRTGHFGTSVVINGVAAATKTGADAALDVLCIAASDETTALTTGVGKVTFRMPYAFTVSAVRASLTTAQTSGAIFTVDINEAGTTIITTKLTIDNTEKTSQTAATPPVISDSSIADDAEITIDIDQVGDGTAKGLKVYLIGRQT